MDVHNTSKRSLLHSLFAVLLLILPIRLFSQPDNYSIVHYTTDEGLPQNSVTSINFDKAGYCWLSTEMGLVRFDGREFKVFGTNDITGLSSDRIRIVTADAKGDIYVRPVDYQVVSIKTPESGRSPYPVLLPDSDVWLPRLGGYALQSKRLKNWSDSLLRSLSYFWSTDFGTTTRDGDTYIVQKNNRYYVTEDKSILLDTGYLPINNNVLLVGEYFTLFYPSGNWKVWLKGILQKQIIFIDGPINDDKAYKAGNFFCTSSAQSKDGYIYAGTTLYRIYPEKGRLVSEAVLTNLAIPSIMCVYYHEEQNRYYIGTTLSGLYIVIPSGFRYPAVPPEAMDDGFYVQVPVKLGTAVQSQRYLLTIDGKYETMNSMDRHMGPSAYLYAQQFLYYGNSATLQKLNIESQVNQAVLKLDSRPETIFPDKTDSSVLNVGTFLSLYKIKQDSILESKALPGINTAGLALCYQQINRDTFLVGTRSGLKWYDYKSNTIYHCILDSVYIQNFYVENPGRIWVSTYGKGFYLYQNNKLYPMPYGPHDALKTVHSFIDDGRGAFWLPTNNGLYKVDKQMLLAYADKKIQDVYFYSFSTSNNLRTNEFNGGHFPSYAWLKDSLLSLSSIQGLVWFYPHKMQIQVPDKKIFIDQLSVDGVFTDIPDDRQITLEPDFKSLALKVSSPYFGNKENFTLFYSITGLDKKWQPVPASGEILFNRLPAGNYSILVQKTPGAITDNSDALTLHINVKPWFYNTWWFYTLISLLACLAVYIFLRIRIRLAKEQNQKLQQVISEQTADLNKTIERLALSEQELEKSNIAKDNLITIVLHDLRSPIRFLHLVSKHVASRFSSMNADELQQKLKEVSMGASSLNDFTDRFFAWVISQRHNFSVKKEQVKLQDVFVEIRELYVDIVWGNGNELTVKETDIVCLTDRYVLSTIIRNLLDNANKNTHNGHVLLSARATGEMFAVTVKDTGRGLSDEQRQSFLEGRKNNNNTGNGSIIILDLVKKLGGRLEIDNKLEKGTAFHVWLPL